MCSRGALRKSLGLDRLPVKVNKQQPSSTLELWVLYQQLKLSAAADAARRSAQQLAEAKRLGHVKVQQVHDPGLSLVYWHSESEGGQTQPSNGMPALQQLNLSGDVTSTSANLNQIPAGPQPQHSGQHTRQV